VILKTSESAHQNLSSEASLQKHYFRSTLQKLHFRSTTSEALFKSTLQLLITILIKHRGKQTKNWNFKSQTINFFHFVFGFCIMIYIGVNEQWLTLIQLNIEETNKKFETLPHKLTNISTFLLFALWCIWV